MRFIACCAAGFGLGWCGYEVFAGTPQVYDMVVASICFAIVVISDFFE